MEKRRSRFVDRRWTLLPIALFTLAFLMGGASAAAQTGQSISEVVVLGDSFSDNGNLYALTGNPGPPYWQGRMSNGPVWAEYLAQRLGVPLSDFAWAGATTGVGNIADGGTVDELGAYGLPGMTTAFQDYLSANPVNPNALYVLWGGANDLRAAITNPAEAVVIIGKAVANLVTMAGTLQALGATQILVLNMLDFGKTPAFLHEDPQVLYLMTQGTLAFNQTLKANLPPGVHYFDTFSRFSDIIANPEAYGLSNVTDQLISTPGADPNTYFFWDGVHPTTAGHAIIANALYQSVAPTVIIGECDSGVPNLLLSTGFTISDLIAQADIDAKNHGGFVSAVASITNELMKSGVISGSQKDAIQGCAAQAMIP
jgi:phospholipase/lecithinase/hemolysin